MSVEGPIEPPLRLNELADVDSPEVVRAALSRFRRRTVVWSLWIVGALVAAFLLLPGYTSLRNDPHVLLARSPGTVSGAVIHEGPVQATVFEVVRVNKSVFAIHLFLTDSALKPEEQLTALNVTGMYSGGGLVPPGFSLSAGKSVEVWSVNRPGSPVVVIPLAIVTTVGRDLPPLRIDLQQLSIPSWIWR
jgi:hypothetical protein